MCHSTVFNESASKPQHLNSPFCPSNSKRGTHLLCSNTDKSDTVQGQMIILLANNIGSGTRAEPSHQAFCLSFPGHRIILMASHVWGGGVEINRSENVSLHGPYLSRFTERGHATRSGNEMRNLSCALYMPLCARSVRWSMCNLFLSFILRLLPFYVLHNDCCIHESFLFRVLTR